MHELIGSIEDVDISNILPTQNIVHSAIGRVYDLAISIKRIGLLQLFISF
jgi:hypothetical protein